MYMLDCVCNDLGCSICWQRVGERRRHQVFYAVSIDMFCRVCPSVILSWLVSGEHVASAIDGERIGEDAVESRPGRIPAKISDELVAVFWVRRFFTTAACGAVSDVIERKRVGPQWMCPICDRDADDSSDTGNVSIACDCCLE